MKMVCRNWSETEAELIEEDSSLSKSDEHKTEEENTTS